MFAFFLLACTESKPVEYEEFTISADVLDFEEIAVGNSTTQYVTMSNNGNVEIELLSASLVDVSANVWELEWQEMPALPAAESLDFAISFTPANTEEYSARMQIRTTMEVTPIIYVQLDGVGGLSILDQDGDGFSPAEGDCDDRSGDSNGDDIPDGRLIYPGAEEACDGIDTNCDTIIPDDEDDLDSDGYMVCEGDCDDQNSQTYPGAVEQCDDQDNDCNGILEDNLDRDEDGQTQCEGDCDEYDPERFLGNEEICDFKDNNCSGVVDDGYFLDADGDGYSSCPSGGDCDDSNPAAHPVFFDSNSDSGGDGTAEFPYNNFNDALDALDGVCRSIMVAPGTHDIASGWSGGVLRVVGAGEYPEATTLRPSGDGSDQIIRVYPDSSLEVRNLQMTGASFQYTGGAIYSNRGDVSLEDVVVIDNQSNAAGGAIKVRMAHLSTKNCEFSYNESGGYGGAISLEEATMIDEGSSFASNEALQGGGLHLDNSTAYLYDTSFRGNTATDEGGAIALYDDSILEVYRGRIWNNQSGSFGGGIVARNILHFPFTLANVRFQGNSSGSSGGAVAVLGYAWNTDETIEQANGGVIANCTFADNFAVEDGGDIYAIPEGSKQGLWVWSNLFAFSQGSSSLYFAEGFEAQAAYNMCFEPVSTCFDIPTAANVGLNQELDPMFTSFTDNGSAVDDNLSLLSGSPAINSGPAIPIGLNGFYSAWTDPDGTPNDRGYTGGENATP